MEIKGRVFAVTGGAGFIGSRLVRGLLEAGAARVTVLDNLVRGRVSNLGAAARDPRVHLLVADLRDRWATEAVVRDADALVHLAALRIPRCQEDPAECVDSMVRGMQLLLDAAVRQRVGRVVFASSVAVYGRPACLPVAEAAPMVPLTFYGAAKAAGEHLLAAFGSRDRLPSTVLRFFNVYGPGMDFAGPHTEVLVRWMEALAAGLPPRVLGDGTTTLDLTHIEDVVRAVLSALQKDPPGGLYNIATGRQVALLDLVRTLSHLSGSRLEPSLVPDSIPASAPRMAASIERASRDLGWVPTVDLDTGLRELWAWYSELRLPRPAEVS